jgi:hypothetical protein
MIRRTNNSVDGWYVVANPRGLAAAGDSTHNNDTLHAIMLTQRKKFIKALFLLVLT